MSAITGLFRRIQARRRTAAMRDYVVNTKHSVLQLDPSVRDFRKQGFSLTESKLLSLGKGNDFRDYISTWEAYQPRLLNNDYFCLSDDKYLFSLVFRRFIDTPKTVCLIQKGKMIPLEKDLTDVDGLIRWIHENGGCVIKDRCGCDGFDVFVISTENGGMSYRNEPLGKDDLVRIIDKMPNGIIQERARQGAYASGFYPGSINTLRIVSIRPEGETRHEIVGALQRIGTDASAPVDNFSQGGLTALIDLESGVLGKASSGDYFDRDGKRIFLSKHPDTGAQIEGVAVPNWKEIKEKIVEVTEQLPFFEYIAWDLVVQDHGVSVLETNMKSSLNIFQVHGGARNALLGQTYRKHGWLVDDKFFK